MICVLHLINTAPDESARRELAALTALAPPDLAMSVRTIGHGGDFRGVLDAARSLRNDSAKDQVVHGWSPSALWAAALSKQPIVHFQPSPARRADARRLALIQKWRGVQTVYSSDATQQRLTAWGVDPAHGVVIPPIVQTGGKTKPSALALRPLLGFSEDDVVLLADGETTPVANHALALWTAGILHELDPRFKLLMWGVGSQTSAIARLARQMRYPGMLRIAQEHLPSPVAYEDVLPASNLVLHTAFEDGPIWSPLCAMAGGVPVVTTRTPRMASILRNGETVQLASANTPRALAQCVLALWRDQPLRDRLAHAAKQETTLCYATQTIVQQWISLYRSAQQ